MTAIDAEPVRTWAPQAVTEATKRSTRRAYGIRIITPGGNAQFSDRAIASRARGYFMPRILSMPDIPEGFESLSCSLSPESLEVEIEDNDGYWKALNRGNVVRLSAVEIYQILPGIDEAYWPTVWTGVVLDPGVAHRRAKITLSRDDFWLQSIFAREKVTLQRFRNADPEAIGMGIPLIYGSQDSTGITEERGMVKLIPVDLVGLTGRGERLLLSMARPLAGSVTVYKSTSTVWQKVNAYQLTTPIMDGLQVTLVDLDNSAVVDEKLPEFAANCFGYETIGDGSGSAISTACKQLEHALRNFAWAKDPADATRPAGPYKRGLWRTRAESSCPLDYDSWDETDNYLQADMARTGTSVAANAGRAGSRYINDQRRAIDELNDFSEAHQVHPYWTAEGLLALKPAGNHRRTKVYLDTWLNVDREEIGKSLDPMPDSSEPTDRITADYTYDAHAEKAQAGLTVADTALSLNVLRTVVNKWNDVRATTTVIDPPSSTETNDWTPLTGGASLHAVLADDLITSYGSTSANGAKARVAFPPMPAALSIASVTFMWQAAYTGASGNARLVLSNDGGTTTDLDSIKTLSLAPPTEAAAYVFEKEYKRNPFTTKRWASSAEVNTISAEVRSTDATAKRAYRIRRTIVFVALQAGEPLVRENVSRDLYLRGQSLDLLKVNVGAEWASLAPGDPLTVSSRALGLGVPRWARGLYTKLRHVLSGSSPGRCALELLRLRPVGWYETHPSDIGAGISRQGIAQLGSWRGVAGGLAQLRVFSRASLAWCLDATGQVVELGAGVEEDSVHGIDIFEAATTAFKETTFASGLAGAGWSRAGQVNGGTIAVDTSQPVLFAAGMIAAQVVKFTYGSVAPGPDLELAWTAAQASGAFQWLGCDHVDPGGKTFRLWAQRADAKYLTLSTGSWGLAKAWNPLPVQLTLDGLAQFIAKIAGIDSTIKFGVGIAGATATAGEVHYLYYFSSSPTRTSTPRVNAQASPATRATTTLAITCTAGAPVYLLDHGCWQHGFVSGWNKADLPAGAVMTFFRAYNASTGNYEEGRYEQATDRAIFRRRRSSVNYDAYFQAPPIARGELTSFAWRWAGAEGELGLPAHTRDVFVNGAKGVSVLAPAQVMADPYTLYLGTDHLGANAANGSFR